MKPLARIMGCVLLLCGAGVSFLGVPGLALGSLLMVLGGALFAHSFLPSK